MTKKYIFLCVVCSFAAIPTIESFGWFHGHGFHHRGWYGPRVEVPLAVDLAVAEAQPSYYPSPYAQPIIMPAPSPAPTPQVIVLEGANLNPRNYQVVAQQPGQPIVVAPYAAPPAPNPPRTVS